MVWCGLSILLLLFCVGSCGSCGGWSVLWMDAGYWAGMGVGWAGLGWDGSLRINLYMGIHLYR
ncbi:hypothetical protein BZA77DRAFT_316844 [Pyronema omphalodes]|nr:hypothetical protein BZA77DRAFT_316844 [Pyronema omphalodes]